jgi:hypothetical protein
MDSRPTAAELLKDKYFNEDPNTNLKASFMIKTVELGVNNVFKK